MLYAVKNRTTGKYVTGTDFRSGKPRQIMDANRAPLLLDDYGGTLPEGATLEMKRRGINPRRYKVVPVVVQEIEKRRQQTEPERKPLPAGYYNLNSLDGLRPGGGHCEAIKHRGSQHRKEDTPNTEAAGVIRLAFWPLPAD